MRSLACGGLTGVFTKVTMLPLDLAKKRLEVSSDSCKGCGLIIIILCVQIWGRERVESWGDDQI